MYVTLFTAPSILFIYLSSMATGRVGTCNVNTAGSSKTTTEQHGVTFQKTELFIFIDTRTYDLIRYPMLFVRRVKVKVKLTLEYAMKAQSERSRALLFLSPRRWKGVVVNATPRPLYARENRPEHTVQEVGWAPRPVCAGAENLVLLGFDPQTVQPVA
jgi:hypothetical protein